MADDKTEIADAPGYFQTTHWSVILAVKEGASASADAALERLCKTYWQPIYWFVRRQGRSPEDAQDLTQEFFARMLSKQYFALADASKGRFRNFLLSSLKHFLINEWAKEKAAKRGGDRVIVPLDGEEAERTYMAQAPGATPEQLFDQRWAASLLDRVMKRLELELEAEKKQLLFQRAKTMLWGSAPAEPYAQIAAELKMTEGALRVAVHRLRHRYREILLEEVEHTVESPQDVQDELRYLLAAVQSQ